MLKLFIVAVFLLIIASLGSALYHLGRHKDEASSQKMVKALTIRIGLSVSLFVLVALLLLTGVLEPTGIGSRVHPSSPTTQAK